MISSNDLKKRYIEFFVKNNHKQIKSSSLIPENDASVLFTTAGMHPLVSYLLGEKHPDGKRLCNVQKCVRTGDIDSVGDNTHCTFFEMLGNWSLGDYFKEESIEYSFKFLTEILNIPLEKLAVTVYEGDDLVERDNISANKWKELGIKEENIFFLGKKDNWWIAGDTGPCGPDTEIFYINESVSVKKEEDNPSFNTGKYIEIWNNVFMEYSKTSDGDYQQLSQKNVDTGMGVERTLCILNNKKSVYDTDVFKPAIDFIKSNSNMSDSAEYKKAIRVIADHIRTSFFILADEKGIKPSNTDQGYIVRRLLRRAIRYSRIIEFDTKSFSNLCDIYANIYKNSYSEIEKNIALVKEEIKIECEKFEKTIENGIKELEKVLKFTKNNLLNGKTVFRLYDTYGFPIEMTKEICSEMGVNIDEQGYHKAFKAHREKSKQGAEQKFKGGLANNSDLSKNLHTATHIMLAGLKKIISNDIVQRGSNINENRLRFDFNYPRPLTNEEIKSIEDYVNDAISKSIDVVCKEMKKQDAIDMGAEGVFWDKYGEIVKVYSIEGVSCELCGGPHAGNTKELGKFKITKEQSSSAGVRRIRAVLE